MTYPDRAPLDLLDLDLLIVGAGLSGIDAAYRLKTECPDRTYAILEARNAIGGTWDLFRYPGIRSDSDMATLGFPFRPWRGELSIASGESIRDYIADTARAFNIEREIRFGHRVTAAAWSSASARWTVDYIADGVAGRLRCRFLYMCSGYYDFEEGHVPGFAARAVYEGQVVAPQFWPEALDWTGKRIVVVGSGATAITLVPELAAKAAHVTMLQRSPTYVVSRPARDRFADRLRRWLPARLADRLIRWKSVTDGMLGYAIARRWPNYVTSKLIDAVRVAVGPKINVDRNFTPRYAPWDQRICVATDGDLFAVLRDASAEIVTDTIDRFVSDGVRLRSGRTLRADIIVMATGLKVQMLGGIALTVDGAPVGAAGRLIYKGAMLAGIPNLAFAFGYTNASWTLKCDLTARFVCRLLNVMDANGFDTCEAVPEPGIVETPMVGLDSGYVQRAAAVMPLQGDAPSWRVHQNYLADSLAIGLSPIMDGTIRFGTALDLDMFDSFALPPCTADPIVTDDPNTHEAHSFEAMPVRARRRA